MSDPFFDPMRAGMPAETGHEPWTIFLDPTLVQVQERERWEARAAQWRARELAELVFGGSVAARLIGPTRGSFRGLLQLDVPFEGLTEHSERERRFTAAAAEDPILGRVPLVFVFGAVVR